VARRQRLPPDQLLSEQLRTGSHRSLNDWHPLVRVDSDQTPCILAQRTCVNGLEKTTCRLALPVVGLGQRRKGGHMEAHKGDRLVIEGNKLGQARRTGEVVKVEGDPAHQRLWVRWEDGHESMLMPGAGARVEPRRRRGK